MFYLFTSTDRIPIDAQVYILFQASLHLITFPVTEKGIRGVFFGINKFALFRMLL